MIEIGRLVVKTAGRDAGKKAVIVDILDDKFVLLDGETRRRKCNVVHIESLDKVLKIEKNAGHDAVAEALKELGIEARVSKPKQKTARPKAKRKTQEQIREQKEEKRKLMDVFRPKKKDEKAEKEESLEAKAGLTEEKEEAKPEEKKTTEKAEKPKETKPKKLSPKKTAPKKKE
ncbi:50S ribosomal protein L14e [Candidatus Woesearchaeota archaeon]|nr:50S ribosomal protein L14e [Candidatus Woesearchaeota archaeon]